MFKGLSKEFKQLIIDELCKKYDHNQWILNDRESKMHYDEWMLDDLRKLNIRIDEIITELRKED